MTVEIPYVYVLAATGLACCVAVGAVVGAVVTLLRGEP